MDESHILNALNSENYTELMSQMYSCSKDIINEKWQNEDKFISYFKAYCVYEYLKISGDRQRGLFLLSLDLGFGLISIFTDFIEIVNATEAKMADLIYSDSLEIFKELTPYIKSPIYKELSKSDKVISQIIKDHHHYITMEEIKSGKYLNNGTNPTGYKITGREILYLDKAKDYEKLNRLAHLYYDEKGVLLYTCNPDIDDNKDIFNKFLKNFLLNTNSNNPEYDIIFDNGTIVNYFMGDIRVKPYNFQNVLTYTKLFYAAHFNDMKKFFNVKEDKITPEIAKQMVKSSFVNVISMLHSLEDVYTQKMIDNSKDELVKIKKIVKDYDL